MTGPVPPIADRLVYAVGDVHGRDDLLATLLDRIRADRRDRATAAGPTPIVFLGDYIDRGGQSRAVIDRLIAFARDPDFEAHFLLGNHEDAMLAYLDGRDSGHGWGRHGGDATMRAYGVAIAPDADRARWSALRPAFAAAVPAAHRAFLDRLVLQVRFGALVFVHAGIRPGIALERQERRDLLWIRSTFLDGRRDDAWFIVHGHSPREQAYAIPGRLCLDSGAYLSGRLTAAAFEGDGADLIETGVAGVRHLRLSLSRPTPR